MAKLHDMNEAMAARAAKAKGQAKSGFSPVAKVESPVANDGDELRWVDVDLTDDNPYQPRLSYPNDKQLEMVNDLNRDGQLQAGLATPVEGKPGRFLLAVAHRRKYAIKEGAYYANANTGEETKLYGNAGSQQPNPEQYRGKILLVIRPKITPLELRRYAYKENSSRVSLAPMELEKFYNDTREALTQDMRARGEIGPEKEASWRIVGDFLGENFRTIHRIARLRELPANMKKALEVGTINEHHGRALMELAEWEKEQRNLFSDIKKHGWSGSHSEKIAAERKKLLNEKVPTPDSLIDEAVEEELNRREQPAAQKQKDAEAAQTNRRGITLVTDAEPATSGATIQSGEISDLERKTIALQQKLETIATAPPSDRAARRPMVLLALESALSKLMFVNACLELLDDDAKKSAWPDCAAAMKLIDENSDLIRETMDRQGITA